MPMTSDDANLNSEDVPEGRVMNDTTLPVSLVASAVGAVPKARQSVVPSSSSSLSRRKVGRFGMADWTRLLASTKDLAQRRGRDLRRIRWDEIRQHGSVHDGWIVLKGKVYFITPYMAYHPGGESILKAVLGKDATELFEKYHRWVNEDGLIGKLQIGYLDPTTTSDDSDEDEMKPSYLPDTISKDGFIVPAPRLPKP